MDYNNFQMIQKALLASKEGTINIQVPFSKVDVENRIVSGFATLDNVDRSGDTITAEASAKAWESFRGNVREQHLPIAAGRVVNFKQQAYYDESTNAMYNGVYVDVYVSKGAQDTWEKVLDGTLSGFSIGGNIGKSYNQYDATTEKTIRYITEYDLVELSLVDSPMNQLCNVFSISKVDSSYKTAGIGTNVSLENVFWCESDKMAISSSDEEHGCPVCKADMVLKGWYEPCEASADKIKEILARTLKSENQKTEGGSDMADEDKVAEKESEEKVEKGATEEVVVDEDTSNVDNEPDFENLHKALTEIKDLVEKYNKNDTDRGSAIEGIKDTVGGFEKKVEAQFAELLEKHNTLAQELKTFKAGLGDFEKRLDSVESDTAVKKSNETHGEVLHKSNSVWSGALLPKDLADQN